MLELLLLLNLTLNGLICPFHTVTVANVTIPQGSCQQAYGTIYYQGHLVGESLNLGCIKAVYTIMKANTTTLREVYVVNIQAVGKGFLEVKVLGKPAVEGYVNGPCIFKYFADGKELCLYYSREVTTDMQITENGLYDLLYVNGKVQRIGLMLSVGEVKLSAICK